MHASDHYTFQSGVKIHKHHDIDVPAGDLTTTWEQETETLLAKATAAFPRAGIYVNVGASVGYYPLLMLTRFPDATVHAFEPLALHRKYLRENTDLNQCAPDRIQIHEEGVAHVDGQLTFFERRFGSMVLNKKNDRLGNRWKMCRVYLRYWLQQAGIVDFGIKCSKIRVLSMQSLCDRVGGAIDLLQADVQGSEMDFLSGGIATLKNNAIRRLLVSTHGSSIHRECLKILQSCGYAITYDREGKKDDGMICAESSAVATRVAA